MAIKYYLTGNRRNTTRGTNTTGTAQGAIQFIDSEGINHVAALLSDKLRTFK